jgi:hypothetical protein
MPQHQFPLRVCGWIRAQFTIEKAMSDHHVIQFTQMRHAIASAPHFKSYS